MALNVYIGNLNGTHLLSFWKVYCKAVNKEFIFFSLICPTKLGATLPCKEFCSLVILIANYKCYFVVQSLSCVLLFASPWTVACQASLSIANTWSLSNLGPSSRWCHPTISSSVVPFSSRLQSFPASGSFPMRQFFTSGGQSMGASASASVLLMNI